MRFSLYGIRDVKAINLLEELIKRFIILQIAIIEGVKHMK